MVEGYVTINGGTFIANKEHTIIVNDTDYGLLSMNGGHVSNNGYGNYSIFITVDCIAKLCALTADAKIYSYSSTNLHSFIPESSALTKGYFRYDYAILPDEETGLIEIVKSGTMFIDAASVTVTAPLSGQAPDLDINNITVGGSTYTVDQITWYNGGTVDNPGVKMTYSDTFEAGQTYIADVHVKPTGGYVIQNGCTVTINGVSTDKAFYRDGINGAGNYRVALTAQPNVLTGRVQFTSAANPGKPIGMVLVDGTVKDVNSTALNYQWQIKVDDTWLNVGTDRYYSPAAADLGRPIRVIVTADGYEGSIVSDALTIAKAFNPASPSKPPVLAAMQAGSSYTTLRVYTKAGQD